MRNALPSDANNTEIPSDRNLKRETLTPIKATGAYLAY
jgi:hypothetical protein